jgi:hypothetical protein
MTRDDLARYYHAAGRLGIDLATARDLARFAPRHARYKLAENCNGRWADGSDFDPADPKARRVRANCKTLANRIDACSRSKAALVVEEDPRGPTLYIRSRTDHTDPPTPVPGS